MQGHQTTISRLISDSTSREWKDVFTSGLGLGTGANAPTFGSFQATGNIKVYLFTGIGVLPNEVHGAFEMQHDYAEGSDISFHVHWEPAVAAAGNVVWQLEYVWKNGGDTVATPTTITVTTAANGAAWVTQFSAFPTITGTGKRIGSQFTFRLFRDPSNAGDTYANDAALTQVGIHYQCDSLGSRQIGSK